MKKLARISTIMFTALSLCLSTNSLLKAQDITNTDVVSGSSIDVEQLMDSPMLLASYNFTYNFKSQLAVDGKKEATKTTAKFSCTTTSNDSDESYFTIKQFKYNFWGANDYLSSDTISLPSKKGSALTSTASFSTDVGTSYTYEFWKSTSIGYVVGSGSLSY